MARRFIAPGGNEDAGTEAMGADEAVALKYPRTYHPSHDWMKAHHAYKERDVPPG